MVFTDIKFDLREITAKKIINNKIKADIDTDLSEERWKEEALHILENEGAVYILTDSKEKKIKGYYFFAREAAAFRLVREYTEKIPAGDKSLVEDLLIGIIRSKMTDIATSSNTTTVNKTYFHDEIILRDSLDVFNRINGCRIVRVKPGSLRGLSSMAGIDKETLNDKVSGTLEKGGEVIAVLFKKNIIGAYFFERGNDVLRLSEKHLINSDLDTKARIEGIIRERIMKIMLYSSFGRKEVINKCYFYDEVICRDYLSPLSIWVCAGIFLITIDAGLAHVAGFFVALALLLAVLFIYGFIGRRKIASFLEK